MEYASLEMVQRQRVGQAGCMVAVVTWAPAGHLLAIGSHDQCIYLCDETLNVHKKLVGATASLISLCFAGDSNTLISNSRDYELLYWDVASGTYVHVQPGSVCVRCVARWAGAR
jgi:hypothetical protein